MATCSWLEKKDWGRREAGQKAFLIHSAPLTQCDLNQLSQVGQPPRANVHRIYTRTWVTEGEGLYKACEVQHGFWRPITSPRNYRGVVLEERFRSTRGRRSLLVLVGSAVSEQIVYWVHIPGKGCGGLTSLLIGEQTV